jgi:molybdopterin/thiamine biosynthesis adenylyltransferase
VGIIGATQAAEAMKIILDLGDSLMGRLLLLNSKDMTWKDIKIIKDRSCKICSV